MTFVCFENALGRDGRNWATVSHGTSCSTERIEACKQAAGYTYIARGDQSLNTDPCFSMNTDASEAMCTFEMEEMEEKAQVYTGCRFIILVHYKIFIYLLDHS